MQILRKILINLLTLLICCVFIISSLLYFSVNWMFKTWVNLTMDELVYTITSPLDGTNAEMIRDYCSYCVAPVLLLIIFLLIVTISLYVNKRKNKIIFCISNGVLFVLSLGMLYSSVSEAYFKLDVKNYSANQGTYSTFIDNNYIDPNTVNIQFPERKRNLIYIFMESMEITYTDEKDGGSFERGCIPELTKIAQENEDFSGENTKLNGAISLPGTTWTMGGLFAQTTGLPLQVSIDVNSMDTQEHFFPGVVALGDILEDEGYSQSLLFGTDASFGGRRLYFSDHGNYDIIDYNYALETGMIPEGYKVWWGFEDHKLFQFAEERLTELHESGQPFNLTMLTVDTHFEDGAPCEYCPDKYGEQYANVMACSSKHLDDFIKWIQRQPFYENTTIIICGDHPTMDSDFCQNVPEDYQRRVYTTYINSGAELKNVNERVYSVFDQFPTTLASLGVAIDGERLGLGTNLFSDEMTLTELYGLNLEKAELSKNSKLMEKLASIDESLEAWKNRQNILEINAERKEKDKKGIVYADVNISEYDSNTGLVPVTINNFHNTEKGIQSVLIAVWTEEDQSDLIWTQAQQIESDKYMGYIYPADWGFKQGTYMIDVYVVDGIGEYTMLISSSMDIQ